MEKIDNELGMPEDAEAEVNVFRHCFCSALFNVHEKTNLVDFVTLNKVAAKFFFPPGEVRVETAFDIRHKFFFYCLAVVVIS